MTNTTTTHLAGPAVHIGRYVKQVCLICGECLHEASADDHGGSILIVGAWYDHDEIRETLNLVEVTRAPRFNSDLDVPDNACVRSKRYWEVQ